MFVILLIDSPNGIVLPSDCFSTVKRVHWLRSRALKDRWHEELVLVRYEMQWTVRYFLHKRNIWWEGVGRPDVSPGGRAYAVRQARMWNNFAHVADRTFKNATGQYVSPMQ
jgi:hypothetical protein